MLSGTSLVWLACQIQRWTHLDPFLYSFCPPFIVDGKCSCSTFNLLNPVYLLTDKGYSISVENLHKYTGFLIGWIEKKEAYVINEIVQIGTLISY
jgi:hypothetical protein